MKKAFWLTFFTLLAACGQIRAQMNHLPMPDILEFINEEKPTDARYPALYKYSGQYIHFTNLRDHGYNLITITNMKGNVVLQREVTDNRLRMDISILEDGVYVLVLRSAAAMKEKNVKFVIRH